MDLSTLPLMPSMDLPPPVEVPVPTAQRPNTSSWDVLVGDESEGCQCAACRMERRAQREEDRTASSMRQQYGSIAVPPTPMIWETAPADWPNVADRFGGAVTGRIIASQPAMANIPRAALPVQSPQRIRGRYTRDTDVNGTLAGGERWLDPANGCLYDNLTGMRSVNSGMTPRVDGTWVNDNGRVWEAT